jgi:hypothetical protein
MISYYDANAIKVSLIKLLSLAKYRAKSLTPNELIGSPTHW